ncbi:MAG: rod-binding protein [Pirellulales bacterium]
MKISGHNAAASLQLPVTLPPRHLTADAKTQATDELRERFTQFVGESFFGQMMKAMRATVGKPAYFHGGRAEEVFQGQLDQKLAEHLTEASAARFAEPMFERQFPQFDSSGASAERTPTLDELRDLRRV